MAALAQRTWPVERNATAGWATVPGAVGFGSTAPSARRTNQPCSVLIGLNYCSHMRATTRLKQLRAAPWIAYYKIRGSKDYAGQWDDYWSRATSTDEKNDVLWDKEDDEEIETAMRRLEPHLDRSLPFVDVGCGNGRRARFLARHFDTVVGLEVSEAAVDLARAQSEGIDNLSYRVLNALDTDGMAALAAELGPSNVYMRGVFHLILDEDRPALLANLADLLGRKGTLYQLDTDGSALEYMLEHGEDSPSGLPWLMHRVVQAGIIPHGFSEADTQRWYGDGGWQVIRSGADVIETQDLGGAPGRLPAQLIIAQAPLDDA